MNVTTSSTRTTYHASIDSSDVRASADISGSKQMGSTTIADTPTIT